MDSISSLHYPNHPKMAMIKKGLRNEILADSLRCWHQVSVVEADHLFAAETDQVMVWLFGHNLMLGIAPVQLSVTG